MEELAGLFLASFAAATLIPLPSEVALLFYLKAHHDQVALAVAVATIGNTAGGMTTFILGRVLPQKKLNEKATYYLRRYGAPVTFFVWLPFVGDAICAAAGWLRVNWIAALCFMTAGRLARYIVVAELV
jgi:membrane protein YqaA with SNARE-associated domain